MCGVLTLLFLTQQKLLLYYAYISKKYIYNLIFKKESGEICISKN